MTRQASSDEWNQMLELIEKLNEYDEYLEFHKIRMGLNRLKREQLVIIQIKKAKVIAELKMLARSFEIIPDSVRKIYY